MVDIQTVSIVIASATVVAGVVYYALQLRQQIKQRQTDLVIRLYSTLGSKEFYEALTKFMTMDFKDYNDYMKKYTPSPVGFSEKPEAMVIWQVGIFFDEIGVLLYMKLIGITLTARLFRNAVVFAWEKMKPIIEGFRKQLNEPRLYGWFEYLYNEMKKIPAT